MPKSWARRVERGWAPNPARDGDLAVIQAGRNWFGTFGTTSHSGPQPYLQEVPLVLYGPGFVSGAGTVRLDGEVNLTDLPAMQAALMDFDFDTAGEALPESLMVSEESPAVIVTAVIDGGGWNVLERWPDATPTLRGLMERGTSIEDVTVGSSPSITPAVHSTLATGVFPREHGAMAIQMRHEDGTLGAAFSSERNGQGGLTADPSALLTPTLADEWDGAMGNAAEVAMVAAQNFHLGMLGHGAALPGADKDIAVMLRDPELPTYPSDAWATNPEYFDLPEYVNTDVEGPTEDLEELYTDDGTKDGLWRGHDIWRLEAAPVFASLETRVLEEIFIREGFGQDDVTDLFYVNYKPPDAAGHRWNMITAEQRDVLSYVDRELSELVGFLEEQVPDDYVLFITADHGQTPLGTDGWAISQSEVVNDVQAEFDRIDNARPIIRTSTALYFLDDEEMAANDVTSEEIATYLSNYTIRDNIPEGSDPPPDFEDRMGEEIFAGVVPGSRLPELVACTS